MTLEHDVQNKSEKNLTKYRQIEEFAKQQGVDFYPAGRGIAHQIMVEEGYAWPGTLAVVSDSHNTIEEGDGVKENDRMITAEQALEKIIGQLDNMVEVAEQTLGSKVSKNTTELHPGFPEKVAGEIVFCDADNINTDGIHHGKYTYQDNVPVDTMAKLCIENYDPKFSGLAKEVVAGSFGNIFLRNSINNALMGLEVPKLVHRLWETSSDKAAPARNEEIFEPKQNRQSLDSPPPAPTNTRKRSSGM
ncbi:hypothetical protein EPUS_00301 [Endocarpon pusillum Z07020]|uniref:Aconitase/3-isopropylmalate dehydratase large subunit alpha/beta/alpha domain-containing protein n=1 Tax=Endocarpon pusillum (strain Z07020 / HMAS-L-300199) TaxID=1263415 RepID=U1HM91_ENDPU|nr:uncharacterized protein EPUS_00301 [Endocarpon pusillum Z07020]ERF70114.1 hypothetical protein EPUS_00301 [Endocarpon pusillum Z07020]